MGDEPLHPLDIPDDTTPTGLAGWIVESVARSLALRLAVLLALLSAVVAVVGDDAPAVWRAVAVASGIVLSLALLVSQLSSWRRARQWALIVVTAVGCGALLATLLRLG